MLRKVTTLVDNGADVNACDTEGKTVIMHAVSQKENVAVVRYLISNGANIHRADAEGKTPLMHAMMNNSDSFVLLIDSGADVNAMDCHGKCALMHAIEAVYEEFFEHTNIAYLVQKGACVNSIDENGMTPLMFAAMKNHIYISSFLVLHGASMNVKDKHGMTALMYALMGCRKVNLIQFLFARGGVTSIDDVMNSMSADNKDIVAHLLAHEMGAQRLPLDNGRSILGRYYFGDI